MNIRAYSSVSHAVRSLESDTATVLFSGDCIELVKRMPDSSVDLTITSPNYCMGREYETSNSVDDFIAAHKVILPEIVRVTREGGSICWQVGYHVRNKCVYPLDYAVFAILKDIKDIVLRNRIVWTFGHGLHCSSRLSGRHETVLWFTKGSDYHFDLDAVRVRQKYPGKKHYRGSRKGELSGNPKGKNPGDVWEIPNVKALHVEKTDHPCQFPVALAQRLIRALSPSGGRILDPFMGSGSTGVAALVEGRKFVGVEIVKEYYDIAVSRCEQSLSQEIKIRPLEQSIFVPSSNLAVAKKPAHFI